jgi:hypothetical protein
VEVEEARWSPPPAGFFKTSWDAATARSQNITGVGAIIRDENGLVIAALSRTIHANLDPQTAEATTALQARNCVKTLGYMYFRGRCSHNRKCH